MRSLLGLLLLIPGLFSLNILVFLIGTNQFERGTFEFLAQQLALRHHEVITVKPILIPEEPRLVKPKLHLVREKTLKNLLPKRLYEPLEIVGDDIPWRKQYEVEEYERPYWAAHNASCFKMLNSNLMDQLKKDSLDLVLVYAGNPCQLAIAHVLGVPVIYFDEEGLTDETLVAANIPINLDIPLSHCSFPTTQITLVNRITNAFCLLKEYIAQSGIGPLASLVSHRYKHIDGPITQMFATDYELKKRFQSFPDVNALKQNAEVFFVNTDPLLEYDRALPPNVIPVAGMHIDHVKPLFSPWNTTIASAEEGLIVVTMGTQANSAKMPMTMAKVIYNVLSKLTKYRIYWRVGPNLNLEGVDVENPPPHINFTAYIPQNDLLAHKKARLLITNGGMLSVMEALAHGVPIVGIPLYGVNQHNLGKVVNKGLGVMVEKKDLNENSLAKAIKSVLESNKYKNVAKDMAREFRERKTSPFNQVLHWIEWVGKQQGNTFFRPPQRSYSLLRSLNLDVILIGLLILYIPFWISARILGRLRGFSNKPASATTPKKENKKSKDSDKKQN